jgi:membrane protein YqaA with SNARE-associated domain
MKKHVKLTAMGVFLSCFFANASVLLPSSSLLIAIEYSMLINPLVVAFCAAAGASFGELTGFCVGRYGQGFLPQKLYSWLRRQVKRHGCLMVFAFSVLPLPLFDVIGMLAGALKMRIVPFFSVCFCGKFIKFLAYVWMARTIIPLIG